MNPVLNNSVLGLGWLYNLLSLINIQMTSELVTNAGEIAHHCGTMAVSNIYVMAGTKLLDVYILNSFIAILSLMA